MALRQGVTPDRLQGRMNATLRSLDRSTAAGGALVGGALGDALGLPPTLPAGAAAWLPSAGRLVCSPVPSLARGRAPRQPGQMR
jgi:hypothetical protein